MPVALPRIFRAIDEDRALTLMNFSRAPFANWYILVVSIAKQAGQILQELHSVQVTVGTSLRARQQCIDKK
jgi:hypothetical protein